MKAEETKPALALTNSCCVDLSTPATAVSEVATTRAFALGRSLAS